MTDSGYSIMVVQGLFPLIWRVLSIQTLILTSVSLFTGYENGWIYKTCDNNAMFKQLIDISIFKCADECFRRQRCEIAMFHSGMKFCALKEAINITALEDGEPLCGYHTLEGYGESSCTSHTCQGNERCTDKAENEYECTKSECLAPNTIENAVVLSNIHDIGSVNRYKCNSDYVGVGRPTIVCDRNAQWTSTEFTCANMSRTCPPPKAGYFNVALISVESNAFYEGTTIHFTCGNGYQSVGERTSSTCTAGEWHPSSVPCCHVNSTHLWDAECIRFIDPGIALTDIDARSYCESLGGRRQWYAHGMSDLLVGRQDVEWILQYTHKSYLNTHWNYTECLISNNVNGVIPERLDDKVNEIKSNDWQGEGCWWGTVWAPGEPDGGEAENCVIVSRVEHLFYDIACDFELDTVGFFCVFGLPVI